MIDTAFPRHDYFYHGIFTDCGICDHPAQCARVQEEIGSKKIDICRAYLSDDVPEIDGMTLEQWCSECEHTIPEAIQPVSLRSPSELRIYD